MTNNVFLLHFSPTYAILYSEFVTNSLKLNILYDVIWKLPHGDRRSNALRYKKLITDGTLEKFALRKCRRCKGKPKTLRQKDRWKKYAPDLGLKEYCIFAILFFFPHFWQSESSFHRNRERDVQNEKKFGSVRHAFVCYSNACRMRGKRRG